MNCRTSMLSFLIELSKMIGFIYNDVDNTENCVSIQTGLCCIQTGGPMLRRFQIGPAAKNENLYFCFSGISSVVRSRLLDRVNQFDQP